MLSLKLFSKRVILLSISGLSVALSQPRAFFLILFLQLTFSLLPFLLGFPRSQDTVFLQNFYRKCCFNALQIFSSQTQYAKDNVFLYFFKTHLNLTLGFPSCKIVCKFNLELRYRRPLRVTVMGYTGNFRDVPFSLKALQIFCHPLNIGTL